MLTPAIAEFTVREIHTLAPISNPKLESRSVSAILPPPPAYCFGRDAALQNVVSSVLGSSSSHVAVIGTAGTTPWALRRCRGANHLPGIGKTTSIHCLAHQLLGDAYKEGVLELNASDERYGVQRVASMR